MIKVLFMGTPEFSVPILDSLNNNSEISIVGVVSQPDKFVGRKRILTPSPISEYAINNNLNLYRIEKIKESYQELIDLNPDIIITAAYGQIIPEELLEYPKYKSINVHASLLPKYRGGAPIEWSIINDDDYSGVTIMYMSKKMDAGDIISQVKIKIEETDNKETLTKKLSIAGMNLLNETLPTIINSTNDRIKQDEDNVTYAYNISHDDEHISFNKTAREVFNHVRALSPNPGCYALLNNKTMKIYNGYIKEENIDGNISQIVKLYKDGIGVKCSDYIYVITELQVEGKKRMRASDYLNGTKEELVGDIYE